MARPLLLPVGQVPPAATPGSSVEELELGGGPGRGERPDGECHLRGVVAVTLRTAPQHRLRLH